MGDDLGTSLAAFFGSVNGTDGATRWLGISRSESIHVSPGMRINQNDWAEMKGRMVILQMEFTFKIRGIIPEEHMLRDIELRWIWPRSHEVWALHLENRLPLNPDAGRCWNMGTTTASRSQDNLGSSHFVGQCVQTQDFSPTRSNKDGWTPQFQTHIM